MRKFLLVFLFSLNFTVVPLSFADDQVIVERITEKDAEDFNIEIPEDVPPGYHTITFEVLDKSGESQEKTVEFCKDLEGNINWDNVCTDLENTEEVVESPNDLDKEPGEIFKAYNPMENTEETKDLQIAAFAILYAITTIQRSDQSKDKEREESEEQESLQSIKAGALGLLSENPGRGDLSRSWQDPLTQKSDSLFVRVANFFNGRSPLLARTVLDGSTIRAILGGWSTALPVAGIILGLFSSFSVGFESLPPAWWLVALIMGIAMFDAFAGFLAGSTFFFSVLLTGNIASRPELLTAIGILILFFAPALLASSFRPFRRLIRDGDDRWEWVTDYLLGGLLTFWVVTKMVGAMNGLARLELPITDFGQELAVIATALLVIRRFLEDIAVRHFPIRLRSIHIDIASLDFKQELQSAVFKIAVFFLMAAPFAGSLINLLLGTLIFAIPQLTGLGIEDKLPKLRIQMPKGALKTVVMIFVMALISKWIESLFSSPESFLKWSFVVMAIPGLFLHYLEAIADKPTRSWRKTLNGRRLYRIGGVIVFVLMVLVVQGVDIASWLVK